MQETISEILIDAPAELVWMILTDFRSYSRWNPFIRAVSGPARAGEVIAVTVAHRGHQERTSRLKLMRVTAPRELCWRSQQRLPGLYEQQTRFKIDQKRGGGGVRFRQIHESRGVLAHLFGGPDEADLAYDYGLMNEALKLRAEKAYNQAVSAEQEARRVAQA